MDVQEWLDLQRALQVGSFGVDPSELEAEERAAYVLWNAYALEDEIHEMLNEIQWKPWASGIGTVKSRERFIGEAVDVMHFLANLLLTVGATGEEIAQAYRAKHEENARRQRDGYDGQKCPNCRRDLKEAGVDEFTIQLDGASFRVRQCGACYEELERETV